MKPIILASSSPRRAELLRKIGISFDVVEPNIDESLFTFGENPTIVSEQLALSKARSAAIKSGSTKMVLGADTIVILGREVFGKPQNPKDAYSMLHKLIGQSHMVLTGFALLDTKTKRFMTGYEWTKVFMRDCSDKEIKEYVQTGESLDKAGAYSIQGLGARFITRIEGCFYNVMGLPVTRILIAIKDFDVLVKTQNQKDM